MKKRVVWLVVTVLMVAALLLASCAPAVVKEEEKVAPPVKEKEAVVVPKEEVVPKEGANFVKWTGKKRDGTVVEKMIEKPRYGGTHTFRRETQPSTWDPTLRGGHTSWPLSSTSDTPIMVDFTVGPVGTGEWAGLMNRQSPYKLTVGLLAESWERPDDSTIIYHVRKGVHWALDPASEASRLVGGREVTANDWVTYFRWAYRAGAYLTLNYGYLSDMANPANSIYVSPTDPWAMVMKFQPGQTAGFFIYGGVAHGQLMPPEIITKYAPVTDWKNLVGTGPFILKDYVGASALTYVRNPNYWMRDPFFPENQLPYVDTYKVLIIPDISTTLAGLRTGKIDTVAAGTLDAEDAESLLKTNPELKSKSYVSSSTPIIEPRHDVKPFDDIRVRQALRMAINYKEMTDQFYDGKAALFASPLIPNEDEDLKALYIPLEKMTELVQELYAYKPDKARQLLADAGYPQGFKAEVLAWSAAHVDQLSIVKEYWAKIGVDLTIDVRGEPIYTSMGLAYSFSQMRISGDSGVIPYSMNKYKPNMSGGMRALPKPAAAVVMALFAEGMARYYDPIPYSRVFLDPLSEVLPNLPEAKGLPNWITYANEQAWFIPLPNPYQYNVWQPWLKHFAGGVYATETMSQSYARYVWIDQELKKAMGR